MRNLINLRHAQVDFQDPKLPLAAATWDADSDAVICAFGPTTASSIVNLKRLPRKSFPHDHGQLLASWDAPCPHPDLDCDRILSLRYFSEAQKTCLIFAGGDIVVVTGDAATGGETIEIMGTVDAGITAASWSPDEDLVAISTKADTLIFMTREFESTANFQMSPEDVKVSEHVSVGWGKKETQFQGKRAKALRDPTMPEHIDEGRLSSLDAGETTISWRGDGAYVAVNSVLEGRRRMLRMFSREGNLESVSEPVDGLEGSLSWRPAGNLMATIQDRGEKGLFVLFFERNGLRHGDFPLRYDTKFGKRPDWTKRISLSWNVDSSVLAVSFLDRVQLWTMGNYHYYLKQEILSPLSRHDPVTVTWHPERPLQLATVMETRLSMLNYTFQVSGGSTWTGTDFGFTAVIDGTGLKLTPLRRANIPPPMSLIDFELPSNIIHVAFNKDGTLVATLHAEGFLLHRLNFEAGSSDQISTLRTISLGDISREGVHSGSSTALQPRQIAMDATDSVSILLADCDSGSDILATHDQVKWHRVLSDPATQIVSLGTEADHSSIHFQETSPVDQTSSVSILEGESGSHPVASLPSSCVRTEVWRSKGTTLIFGLGATGTLYVHGQSFGGPQSTQRLRVKGVTSFLITKSHLIFTTSQHIVKFVHLHEGELEVPADEAEKDERCRAVERGARLVTAMPSVYALVLQMPRGNLETIYPRALVLAGIRNAIMGKKYKKAFLACRNHRVDMNILHDHAPEQFTASIPLFVQQLNGRQEYLDLFLSQLRDEDVAQTLYRDTLGTPTQPEQSKSIPSSTTGKVNRICASLIEHLTANTTSISLHHLLTAHACKSPPDLASALSVISTLRASSPASVDTAIEHLCFLSDANRLHDVALSLYDLDVALLVAQNAQKDPREYLPYLQGLQEMEECRRRYTIDNDQKRWSRALGSLVEIGDGAWEEAKRYAVRHEIHADLEEKVKYDKKKRAEVMRLWAEWWESRSQWKEAGMAWEGLGEWKKASDAYLQGSMWREGLGVAALAGSDTKLTATGLVEGLEEGKQWTDAAIVWRDYLGMVGEEIRCWCKAYRFDEAIRAVGLGKDPSLLSKVDEGLADGFAAMSEMLAEMKVQIAAQVGRLRELREKKRTDPLAFYDDAPASGNPDIPDDMSLAPSANSTSAGTFMTRYTNRTDATLATNTTRKSSKNRRREERKKARGKKGSVYEEEYLVSSVGRLVERLNGFGDEVQRLVEGLMRRDMRERAATVQTLMHEVGDAARASLPEVYERQDDVDEARVTGDQAQQHEGKKELPVIKPFEGVHLLRC